MAKETKTKIQKEAFNHALDLVHEELADFYDKQYQKNPTRTKRVLSPIILKLKRRIEKLEVK